jgi:hypothetical protein
MTVALGTSACGQSATSSASALTPAAQVVVTPGPVMTHPVEGRDDCRSCHVNGPDRVKKMPADHANYANDTCRLCHKQIGEQ